MRREVGLACLTFAAMSRNVVAEPTLKKNAMPHAEKPMSRIVIGAVAALAFLAPVAAAGADQPEPAYLDDRSTAEAVIRSLYNAIDRKEYARAYGYFNARTAPAYEKFAAGYADTESVDVAIGKVSAEGAAGSTYWAAPVAIRAHKTKGGTAIFAGCYTLRLAQPAIQSPPFRGIHIETAKLKAAGGTTLEKVVPKSCPP
jgi:hypothetical protein